MAGQNDFFTVVRTNLVHLTKIDIPMEVFYSLSASGLITKGEFEELSQLTVSNEEIYILTVNLICYEKIE